MIRATSLTAWVIAAVLCLHSCMSPQTEIIDPEQEAAALERAVADVEPGEAPPPEQPPTERAEVTIPDGPAEQPAPKAPEPAPEIRHHRLSACRQGSLIPFWAEHMPK